MTRPLLGDSCGFQHRVQRKRSALPTREVIEHAALLAKLFRDVCSPFFPFDCFFSPDPVLKPIPGSDKSPFLPEDANEGDSDEDDEDERSPDVELVSVFEL